MQVLVIEDDPVIGKAVQQSIREGAHECVWVKDGKEGLQRALTQQFDVVVLDLLLPGQSGLSVLDKLRKEGIKTPVLILTALGAIDDRVKGLSQGADDYLVKPFAMP